MQPASDEKLCRDALRRLVVSIILREQKKSLIRADQSLLPHVLNKSHEEIDAIEVTEGVLGFDSLATLDLIFSLNQFLELGRSGIEDYLLIRRKIGDWIELLNEHQEIVQSELRFGFETSGSAGPPKLVRHKAEMLWSEMKSQAESSVHDMHPSSRIILLVPPYHIYGFLFGCVLPDLLGIEVIDLYYSGPTAVFRHARAGDLVIGTPLNWELLHYSGQNFPDGVLGITSAAPSTPETWKIVRNNNLLRLTEVYGATETGGVGCRTECDASFELFPHLDLDTGSVVRQSDCSQLTIQDRLEWTGPRTFRVKARLDEVVQIAGVNVSPEFIRRRLLQVDGVAEVAVRPCKARLKAFVVPKAGIHEGELKARLQSFAVKNFDAPARPASFKFGNELPHNEMGKATDWA